MKISPPGKLPNPRGTAQSVSARVRHARSDGGARRWLFRSAFFYRYCVIGEHVTSAAVPFFPVGSGGGTYEFQMRYETVWNKYAIVSHLKHERVRVREENIVIGNANITRGFQKIPWWCSDNRSGRRSSLRTRGVPTRRRTRETRQVFVVLDREQCHLPSVRPTSASQARWVFDVRTEQCHCFTEILCYLWAQCVQ